MLRIKLEKKPLVTIGVPTFNRATYLNKTLSLFTKQTYKNIEIIVSDNCSTDETKNVCQAWKTKDKRIRYYRQKKAISAIANFNFTLQKAKGEFFMVASDDDIWDKNYIAQLMQAFLKERKEVLVVSSKFNILDRFDKQILGKRWSFAAFKNKYVTLKDYLLENFNGFKTGIFYGIYRTESFRNLGGYLELPALSAPDFVTMHKILLNGELRLVNKVLFHKREQIVFYDQSKSAARLKRTFSETFKLGLGRLLTNLLPSNLVYLWRNVWVYIGANFCLLSQSKYRFNVELHFLNFLSGWQLFVSLFPNDIQALKKRNRVFTDLKILKRYGLEK